MKSMREKVVQKIFNEEARKEKKNPHQQHQTAQKYAKRLWECQVCVLYVYTLPITLRWENSRVWKASSTYNIKFMQRRKCKFAKKIIKFFLTT